MIPPPKYRHLRLCARESVHSRAPPTHAPVLPVGIIAAGSLWYPQGLTATGSVAPGRPLRDAATCRREGLPSAQTSRIQIAIRSPSARPSSLAGEPRRRPRSVRRIPATLGLDCLKRETAVPLRHRDRRQEVARLAGSLLPIPRDLRRGKAAPAWPRLSDRGSRTFRVPGTTENLASVCSFSITERSAMRPDPSPGRVGRCRSDRAAKAFAPCHTRRKTGRLPERITRHMRADRARPRSRRRRPRVFAPGFDPDSAGVVHLNSADQ